MVVSTSSQHVPHPCFDCPVARMVVAIHRQLRGRIVHKPLLVVDCCSRFWEWSVVVGDDIVVVFLVVKGGVSLNTATVGSSEDVLVFDGASNVGSVAVGGVVTSVVVESPSVDCSNAPQTVVAVAAVGVGTALTERMFNLQGQIVVPPRSYAAIMKVVILLVVKFLITSTWVMMP